MKLKSFTGPGSTPSRRRFWDRVTQAVVACQKVAGENVSVDEYQGMGTVINVGDTSTRRPGGPGACCYNDGTCDDLTEADCDAAEGNWQGPGTTCADDPNPCLGACCVEDTCSILSAADCATSSGTFQGAGTDCDPNPCCTTCEPTTFGAPCTDLDDNCWTVQNCDGTCGGEMVPCDSNWMTLTQYCFRDDCSELFCESVTDPVTCEFTQTGPCDDSCPEGTVNTVSVRWFPCP